MASRPPAPAVPADGVDLPALVRALLRPGAYPHPAGDLRLHETHISWVVLAGRFAYKLKKPVNFGFLDFTTLARRAAACEDEVRLNRRLCPDVYLGVTYVVERQGAFYLGGPGRAVEPVVWMRRLPAEGMLSHLLAADAVTPRLVRRIARHLARFHTTAATGPGVDDYGHAEAVAANWRENFDQTAPFVGSLIPPAVQERIRAYVERFFRERADLLERRVAVGRVREGHGDLHAASICLDGRRLQFFDCLEFNPRFRCADVAAEVAFLAMDLDHYGRADLSAVFVETYVRASGDRELLALLDFYRCYRAYVRGKVWCLRLAEHGLTPDEEAEVTAEARAYFDLAWSYAGGLPRRTLVMAMGPPASGKTSLARALARRFGLVHLSSDVVRKELAGIAPTDRRYEPFGRGLYDPAMTRRTYGILRRRAGHWLRAGRPVVVDATFGRPAERTAFRRLAARARARLIALVCRADDGTLRARLAAREGEGRTTSDARLEIWPALRAAYSEPAEIPDALPVDMEGPLAPAIERVLAFLRGSPSPALTNIPQNDPSGPDGPGKPETITGGYR
jgi:aminoglycoside phosphotransferase family enzyme/predicted kinase